MLAKLAGKKTYILVILGAVAYLAGMTDKAPFEVSPEQAENIGTLLWGLAVGTLRQAVAKAQG